MDQWVQWVVTTVIAIIALFIGRIWERYDHRLKKDRILLDEILKLVPKGSDTYTFLNKKLEIMKQKLFKGINGFNEFLTERTFPHQVNLNFYEIPDPNDVLVGRARIIRGQRELSDEEFRKMENEVRESYQQTREKLNLLSTDICEKYDALISTAHRIL